MRKPRRSAHDHNRKIEELQKSVINAINNSCLHPAVVRLVLLNVISMVEASEREVNKKEEKATR